MTIGVKRERVRFVRRTRVKRDDGGFDLTDTTLAEIWAEVVPFNLRGASLEAVQSGHLVGPSPYTIRVDNRAVSPVVDDTIIWLTNGNRELNIREIKTPMGRTPDLEVTAEFGVTISG